MIYIKDPEGRYLLMNSAGEALFEMPRAEIVGTRDEELFGPEEAEEIRAIDRRVMDEQEPETYESRRPVRGEERIFRNEKYPYVTGDGAVAGVIGVSKDVTEERRRRDALEELHEATREMMVAPTAASVAEIASETTASVIGLATNSVSLHDPDGDALVPVAWSDPSGLFGGEAPPTFPRGTGVAWAAYASGEPRSYADVREAENVLNPETQFRSEIVLPLGSHGVLMIGSTAVDDFDENDEALARVFAANVEAALDRVERERELHRQNERLSEFAGVVSHDIRNPLNLAQTLTQSLDADVDHPHLERIRDAHDRIGTIVSDVMTWARQGTTVEETEYVSVEALATRCWAEAPTGEATLVVEDDFLVRTDRERFRRVLENLFRNAIEHGGPAVTVRVGRLEDATGFFVADTGPGIPEDERESVLEIGHSTSDGGTGFGLAICEQIADAHGWTLDVTEGVDGGARFEFGGVEIREPPSPG